MSCVRVSRLLFAALMLVLTACQVDVDVELEVTEDGSGTVTIEARFDDAADQALGGISPQLRISDLQAAGWDVVTATTDDGNTTVSAAKEVPSAGRWQDVLDEIAGPGLFNDVQVTADDEFANASQRISFELDLTGGWDLFTDESVAEALDGEPFGAPIDTLTDGRSLDEIIAVNLTTSITSDDTATPSVASSSPRFDSPEPLRIQLESRAENATAVLVRWVAIALFSLFVLATVLAITGIVLQRRADRLRPAPTPASLLSRVPGTERTASPPSPAATGAATQAASGTIRLVVVEPLSVLYTQTRPVDDVLLPFVRAQGGGVRADTILDGYRSLIAGSTTTAAFWGLCGLDGDPDEIDEEFVGLRQLRSGAADFMNEMQHRRIPVAATTNDAVEWSELTRDRDRLRAVWPWLISSNVGTTTDNAAMFEILRRESGVAHGHCLYVDSDIENLDMAKELGMKTALFDSGDLELPEMVGHPTVSEFKSLFGSK